MKSAKNSFIALLALALAGLAFLDWKHDQELRVLRSELNDGEDALLKKQLADARKALKDLQSRAAALARRSRNGEVSEGADGSGGPGDGEHGPRRPGGPGGGPFAGIQNLPEYQKLIAIEQKAVTDQRYGALYKQLALTPQQLQKFQSLLAEKQQALTDVLQAANQQQINPRTDPEEFKQMVNQAEGQIDSTIQQTLGDAGYSQYQQYQQTLPERNVVNQVTQQLSYTPTPLTDDQAAQLVQLLAATQPQHTGNGTAATGPGDGVNIRQLLEGGGTAQVTTDAVTQAQNILTPVQVQALQQVEQQQQAQAQMRELMRSTQQAALKAATGGSSAPVGPR